MSALKKSNFFFDYWHFLALAGSLAVLAIAIAVMLSEFSIDAGEVARERLSEVDKKHSATGVDAVDLSEYKAALKAVRKPGQIRDLGETEASFLAPASRVFCVQGEAGADKSCGMPIPEKSEVCPFCGAKQPTAVAAQTSDTDKDGMPDKWEKAYGLNPSDPSDANGDLDNDGFTNLEEFLAGTNPADAASHPDYLKSLKVGAQLTETKMPFIFTAATKVPSGYRCSFYLADGKDDYGRKGITLTAIVGEEIGETGFTLKSYEQKSKKVAIKGSEESGLTKTVDASEVVVVRKRDSKEVTLTLAKSKKAARAAVDTEATLTYTRGGDRTFNVAEGAEFELTGGAKYKVLTIKTGANGPEVLIEDAASGRKTTISALE